MMIFLSLPPHISTFESSPCDINNQKPLAETLINIFEKVYKGEKLDFDAFQGKLWSIKIPEGSANAMCDPIPMIRGLFMELRHIKIDKLDIPRDYIKTQMTNAATKLEIFRDGMFDYLDSPSGKK